MPVILRDLDELVDAVKANSLVHAHPVVGISGYGGSGKSTLAAQVMERMDSVALVAGDDYIVEDLLPLRSSNWACYDRRSMLEELPSYRRHRPSGTVVLVEGCSIFHPEMLHVYTYRIWVKTDLETATRQGSRRDAEDLGVPQEALWNEVWKPNEEEFFARFRPDLTADAFYQPF